MEFSATTPQEKSFQEFIAQTYSSDVISGSQKKEVELSRHNSSSSEKMAKTGEHTKKSHSIRSEPEKDPHSYSSSSGNRKSKGIGQNSSLVNEPVKSDPLKKHTSVKKESRIVTVSTKTTTSKLNVMEQSESDTVGSDFEFQESIHTLSHLS